MKQITNIILAFHMAGFVILGGMTLPKVMAQDVSSNFNNEIVYSDVNEYNALGNNAALGYENYEINSMNVDCGTPCATNCFDPCVNNCYNPCDTSCNGVFPFFTDVANIALTPVQWVADLLTYGTYAGCGCAPKPIRNYCDPCDSCGNWVGCNYCGGQGCSSCASEMNINSLDYASVNSDYSQSNEENLLQQPLPQSIETPLNTEELPNNVIKNQNNNSSSQMTRPVPRQIAMRPQNNSANQGMNQNPNIVAIRNQQKMNQQTGMNSNNVVIPQNQMMQNNIQQNIPLQMQPLQNSAGASQTVENSTPSISQESYFSPENTNRFMLSLPVSENKSGQISQQNPQRIRVYYQQMPMQQQNQIVQVGSQTNRTPNHIRPVNYNDQRLATQDNKIFSPNYLTSFQKIVPTQNKSNLNYSTQNGTVQMIIVPSNQIQQPVQMVYQQNQAVPAVQQPVKLNQSYGK